MTWRSGPAAITTISCCLKLQSLSLFTEEIWSCSSDFPSLYIPEDPLNHEGVDTLMCFVSLEGKMFEELFVFVQVSLSLKQAGVGAGFLMYIMYIVVHTVCDIFCTGGCPLTSSHVRRCLTCIKMQKSAKSLFVYMCIYTYSTHMGVCVYGTPC